MPRRDSAKSIAKAIALLNEATKQLQKAEEALSHYTWDHWNAFTRQNAKFADDYFAVKNHDKETCPDFDGTSSGTCSIATKVKRIINNKDQ